MILMFHLKIKKHTIKGIILLFFLVFICLLCSCNDDKHNAVIYNDAEVWISIDFLKDNRVKAYYLNEDYIEGESDPSSKYTYDETLPTFRTFIFTQQEEFAKVFSKCDGTFDFENEMVILYIFSDIYPNGDYEIKKINYQDQTLNVHIKLQNGTKKDSTAPYQRCVMIKIEKLEIEAINFIDD